MQIFYQKFCNRLKNRIKNEIKSAFFNKGKPKTIPHLSKPKHE